MNLSSQLIVREASKSLFRISGQCDLFFDDVVETGESREFLPENPTNTEFRFGRAASFANLPGAGVNRQLVVLVPQTQFEHCYRDRQLPHWRPPKWHRQTPSPPGPRT